LQPAKLSADVAGLAIAVGADAAELVAAAGHNRPHAARGIQVAR
jgi:hypothetical protein